jgi:hypothetical protein
MGAVWRATGAGTARAMARACVALTLALLMLVPATASARINIRVGIGDQSAAMFDQAAFQRAKFKRVRFIVPHNLMNNAGQRLSARAYVLRARAARVKVLLHVSTHDYRIKRGKRPSSATYGKRIRRLVRYFRNLGVREFGTWNEANHASQPTWNSPSHAALYFRHMYRAVKRRCRSCAVIALDVLDQPGVTRYMRRFYRRLSRRFRRRATLVGIHNYGDVNRKRTRYTRDIIRRARRYNRRTKFWITETGGIVKFGRSFPCSTPRAAKRLRWMFRLARRYRRSGVRRLYVYNWTGAGCAARFDAGLTTPGGRPRAGYRYLRRALPNYRR